MSCDSTWPNEIAAQYTTHDLQPHVILANMKTIAITMDEDTLKRIDGLTAAGNTGNRSRIIREAVREYLLRVERAAEEEREREVFRKHRSKLARQAAALVKEQAKP